MARIDLDAHGMSKGISTELSTSVQTIFETPAFNLLFLLGFMHTAILKVLYIKGFLVLSAAAAS